MSRCIMDYIEGDLFSCIVTGDIGRLKVFVGKGLSVNHVFRSTEFRERLGRTLLEIAVREKQTDVVKFLVEMGCNANLTYVVSVSEIGYVIKPYRNQDRLKITVLFSCIVQGDVETIRLLVQGGFDVNVVDDRGCSAIWHAVDLANYEMVKVMLSAKGSDVNLPDRTKLRPLHIAAIHGNTRILTLLLRHGAEVDAVQIRGSTALCLASRRGDLDSVRYLLLNGADPNHVGCQGHTPLSSAIRGISDVRVVSLLIDAGARVTMAIIQACQDENPLLVKEHPQVFNQLQALSSRPQTLQMLCSLEIRRCLMKSSRKTDLLRKSCLLPLPKPLREYVILSHLC